MKITIAAQVLYYQVLQLKLTEYFNSIQNNLDKEDYTSYCQDLVLLENLYTVLSFVNKKAISKPKTQRLKLSITQAIVLQSACNFHCNSNKIEEKSIYSFISDQVHQQIKSLQL
jgi:hypothetical protein